MLCLNMLIVLVLRMELGSSLYRDHGDLATFDADLSTTFSNLSVDQLGKFKQLTEEDVD